MKHQSYLNRALKARDPRYRRIMGKLGYDVSALSTEPAVDNVADIPDDWRELAWPALKSLASKVSDETIKNKDDAVAAIELEVERRKASR